MARGQNTALKEILREKGIPQVRLALEVGRSLSLVTLVVNGWQKPSEDLRRRIVNVVGEPEDRIFPDPKG
jgi:hypothetical protein